METSKLVDDLVVNLKYQVDSSPRSCFVVFSSREKHVEIVIDCAEAVFKDSALFEIIRLDQHLKSEDSQYGELLDLLSSCCFAIVILDGFRPNVLFEYGILKGLNKPCIVMLEENATVDIPGFFPSNSIDPPTSPKIDMDKQFSDVKDRYYTKYNMNNPKKIRELLQKAYNKLEDKIEDEFFHSLFPYKEFIEEELTVHLNSIIKVMKKKDELISLDDVTNLDQACENVERITKGHNVSLPQKYYSTIAHTYQKSNNIDKALDAIDAGLVGDIHDVTLLIEKADILSNAKRSEEVIQVYDNAIKLIPKFEYLWHNKALELDRRGDTHDAINAYKKAISIKSGCSSVHFHYGLLLYEEGDFTSALKQFKAAIKLDKDNSEYEVWKARALKNTGEVSKARTIIEKLLSKDDANANAWFVLGNIEQDDAKSLKYYQKVINIQPEHGGALCSSASCLSNLGKHEEALKLFLNMPGFCFRSQSCAMLVSNTLITVINSESGENVIEKFENILSENPDHQPALAGKAACLAHSGDYEAAVSIIDNLIEQSDYRNGVLVYSKARFSALSGLKNEAVQSLQEAILIDPEFLETAKADEVFNSIRRTKAFREVIGLSPK